jgi:Ser/Thr protein kinase RdoA (MazF antagonist)
MTWLAECSAAALGEALRGVAPELSARGRRQQHRSPAPDQLPPTFTTATLRDRLGTWIRPDQRRTVIRWCDWADAILAAPAPAILVHGDLHGDNQVWDHDELRLVVDFATAGTAEPELAMG